MILKEEQPTTVAGPARAASTLKAQWSVTAGVIPGQQDPDFSRAWDYTSLDFAADKNVAAEQSRFFRKMDEAHAYAKRLTNPCRSNWVDVKFRWF